MDIFIGILIPFIGTTLGSLMVFLLKEKLNNKFEKLLLGFASGVMIAASIWSLIIPSIEMAKNINIVAWVPATIGFLLGTFFLLILDFVIPYVHLNKENEDKQFKLSKNTKLVLAVTLHNIPEGMAVGVIFAGILSRDSSITLAGAFALSIGIAIQNFPEGAIISMPLKSCGMSKLKSFIIGTLSGVVEPIAAIITVLLINMIKPVLPYLLAFAAGSMIYVVVEELIPDAHDSDTSRMSIIGTSLGFVLMMILDVALG